MNSQTRKHSVYRLLSIFICFLLSCFFLLIWKLCYDESDAYILQILNHIWLVAILLISFSKLAFLCCNQGFNLLADKRPIKVSYCVIKLILYDIVYVTSYVKFCTSVYRESSDIWIKVYIILWLFGGGLWIFTNTTIHVMLICYTITRPEVSSSDRLRQIAVMSASATLLSSIVSIFITVFWFYHSSSLVGWGPLFISLIAATSNELFSDFEFEYLIEQYPSLHSTSNIVLTVGLMSAFVNFVKGFGWMVICKFTSIELPPFHDGSHEIRKEDVTFHMKHIQFDNYYAAEGICFYEDSNYEFFLLISCQAILMAHLLELKHLLKNMPRIQIIAESEF